MLSSTFYAQTSKVIVKVKWKSESYNHKLELYNAANDLVISICDDTQCYSGTQTGGTDKYVVKYNLGCVDDGNNYYVKLYDYDNDGWSSSSVNVKVAGVTVINNDGTGATTAGQNLYFNVSGGAAECNAEPDMDQDGIADYLDYDDDGDGLTDGAENLGEDRFECTLPPLVFENGAYDAAASSSSEGTVGAVYRFGNAIEGKDVLLEVLELDNTTISDIDVDTIDNPSYLQTQLTMTGTGTPGARFKFTIVDSGTTTPSVEVYRINGISWDVDGGSNYQESHVYYDVAAYGTENPTALEVTDLGSNNIQISANGEQEGPGFSTLKILRAYYQFIGNSFEMRMQLVNKTTTGSNLRQFGMSFTQCEFLDFNANSLIIITGEDFDGDGKYNHLDLDSDNDGIPDNVEAQTTLGYIAPSNNVNQKTGIDYNYGEGLSSIDTDGDNTPDVLDLDTDGDGLPDIEENGMANSITTFSDSDSDGLDNNFEGVNSIDANDVNDEINNPSASVLPDTEGDLNSGGDLDYRDLFNINPPDKATIDFDGDDDYLSGDSLLEGLGELTIMAWVKIDPSNSGNTYATIAGEGDGCKLSVRSGNRLVFGIRTAQGYTSVQGIDVNYNEWHHVVGTFSNVTGEQIIYVDGQERRRLTSSGLVGEVIAPLSSWNGNFEIGRLSSDVGNQQYFPGNIDEVRVFNSALSDEQIQQMVYQEIEMESGNVKGKVTPKQIKDTKTLQTVPWSSLMGYWPMTDIKSSTTTDLSGNGRTLKLMNIRTVQEQTAPMPYETGGNGDWTNEGTWLHGDVWDIEDVSNNKDWGIVHIKHNVASSASHTNLALLIDSDRTLTINGDNKVENNWYLELNGTLDLMGDSQLIQTVTSDLVTSANGKVLRRQEGTSSVYWYNYWASPVGNTGATTFTDNNLSTNNTNNTTYNLGMLKKPNGSNWQFTSAYDEVGKISTRWLYTYKNGVTYYDYAPLGQGTQLQPGVGYTQKGTGISGSEQQYLFEGKPNNGTIVVPVTDTGGSGSVPAVSKTDYLLGNPYPSALDIHEFIDDNIGVIDGTIQLWQQWSGSSHYLDEYNGGYAQVNKLGSVRAYQFVGIEGETNGSQDGTKTPSRYLPVGQGFMTEIENSGNIVFKNSQRVFIKESDANGSYNNGSVFFRGTSNSQNVTEQQNSDPEENPMQKIRLEFNSVDGPATRRELLLGFSEDTSDDYDYGYDSKNVEEYSDDLNLALEDELMTMQAYGPITEDKVVPLVLKTSGSYNYTIKVSEMENTPEAQELYIKDNLTGEYFDLRNEEQPFEFSSEEGEFNDRLEIVFQQQQSETLSQIEENIEDINLYYAIGRKKIVVLNPTNEDLKSMEIINMLGQSVARIGTFEGSYNEYGLPQLSAGTYIVNLTTATGASMTRKFIVK